MKRVVIELVQRSCNRPRSPVLCIDGVIIAGTIVDIDRSIHVQGNSASRLPEFMPELQVGAIDIKPCVDAGCMPDLGKDGVQVLVGGKRVGITKGRALLESDIGTEDYGIIAVKSRFQVGIDPVVLDPGDGITAARRDLGGSVAYG